MKVFEVQAWMQHTYPSIKCGKASKYLVGNAQAIALRVHFGYQDDLKMIFKLRYYMTSLGHTFKRR